MKAGIDYVGLGCGALILNEKGEALLLKRGSNTRNNAGYWSQPGGTVDFGETVEDAIKREIKEELNIDIELTQYLGHINQIIPEEGQHWVSIAYLGKIVSGKVTNMEPQKHEEIRWFPLSALPEKVTVTTLKSMQAYLQRKLALALLTS